MRSHAVDNEVRVLTRLKCRGAAKVPPWVGQMEIEQNGFLGEWLTMTRGCHQQFFHALPDGEERKMEELLHGRQRLFCHEEV